MAAVLDTDNATHESVQDYYGNVLQSSDDLQTSACCMPEAMPKHLLTALRNVHDEILDRFYGCGSPIPAALDGATVLDLGCGTGRDAYMISQLAGKNGSVIGVDMTDEQLEVARKHQQHHAEKFGFANTDFRKGLIEDLASAGIADNSVDVVVSNCVLNLAPEKSKVFEEIFRVLKPGGELYFSDVFSDRRLPEFMAKDPVLLGECLGGALYYEDFRRMMSKVGFEDPRICADGPIDLRSEEIIRKAGYITFKSLTVRAFKLPLEDRCEDFGQVATYKGSLPEHPHAFDLDDHHHLETGRPMLVCGNSADMLSKTRFAKHFTVTERGEHFGLFDCGPDDAMAASGSAAPASCC